MFHFIGVNMMLMIWHYGHVTWLDNKMHSKITGCTPIELLSNTHSDHQDLPRTHALGCPTFVFDPNLQNDQKIPKWNQHA